MLELGLMDAPTALAITLRPLVFFLLLLALAPLVWAIRRYLPDGKLKRLLLLRVGPEQSDDGRSTP